MCPRRKDARASMHSPWCSATLITSTRAVDGGPARAVGYLPEGEFPHEHIAKAEPVKAGARSAGPRSAPSAAAGCWRRVPGGKSRSSPRRSASASPPLRRLFLIQPMVTRVRSLRTARHIWRWPLPDQAPLETDLRDRELSLHPRDFVVGPSIWPLAPPRNLLTESVPLCTGLIFDPPILVLELGRPRQLTSLPGEAFSSLGCAWAATPVTT